MSREEIINMVAKVECSLFYEWDEKQRENKDLKKLQEAISDALGNFAKETK